MHHLILLQVTGFVLEPTAAYNLILVELLGWRKQIPGQGNSVRLTAGKPSMEVKPILQELQDLGLLASRSVLITRSDKSP